MLYDDLARVPSQVYKKNWKGWDNFLGLENFTSTKKFKTYKKALKFAHKLKLNSKEDWDRYRLSDDFPDDLPSAPILFKKISSGSLTVSISNTIYSNFFIMI